MAKKQSYLKKKQTFSGAQILLFVLLFAAVGTVAIWQSLAAPHNGGSKPGSGNSLSLIMVKDLNGDGSPNYGDTISFNVVDNSSSQPFVVVKCYQSGALVMTGYTAYFEGALNGTDMTLNSGIWHGGAADCTATMFHYQKNKTINDASLNFHANA